MPLLKALIRLEHGKSVIILLSVWRVTFCQRHHVPAYLQGKQLLGTHHAIQGLRIHPNFPEKHLQTPRLFKAARDIFFLAFEDTLLSIKPQLPLKHNQCLPTRLPSTSCLVTTSPLLSTTERLTNSMSELNLETPLIYPPHWIDRSWLHRGSLSRTGACLIFTQHCLPHTEIKSCHL